MSFKIMVSDEGINVLGTAVSDPTNLFYSSDYNTFKYFQQGTIGVTYTPGTSVGTTEGTVAHNLGYIPFFTGNVDPRATYSPTRLYVTPFNLANIGATYRFMIYADGTNLYCTVIHRDLGLPGQLTTQFQYKIFRNDLGL